MKSNIAQCLALAALGIVLGQFHPVFGFVIGGLGATSLGIYAAAWTIRNRRR